MRNLAAGIISGKISKKPVKLYFALFVVILLNGYEKDSIYYGMNQAINRDKDYAELNWGTGDFTSKEHVEHASLQKFLAELTKIGFKEAADALLEEPGEALND